MTVNTGKVMGKGMPRFDRFVSTRGHTCVGVWLLVEKVQPFNEFPSQLVEISGVRSWPRSHYEINSGKFGQDR